MQAAGQALCERRDFGRGSRIFLQRAGELPSRSCESGLEYLRKLPAFSRTQTGITHAGSLVGEARDEISQTAALSGEIGTRFPPAIGCACSVLLRGFEGMG